jgi:hypothetical protein
VAWQPAGGPADSAIVGCERVGRGQGAGEAPARTLASSKAARLLDGDDRLVEATPGDIAEDYDQGPCVGREQLPRCPFAGGGLADGAGHPPARAATGVPEVAEGVVVGASAVEPRVERRDVDRGGEAVADGPGGRQLGRRLVDAGDRLGVRAPTDCWSPRSGRATGGR